MHANALGQFDAEQRLHREAERHAVGLRAQVVHPLDERNHLLPLLLLGGLLDAGVQVADRRRRREHRFAVELEHEPQHAVRAGVLGPHVDGHRFGANLGMGASVAARQPVSFEVRAEFLLGHLQRLAWRTPASESAPGSPCAAGSLPSLPASAAAADRDGRRRRSRTDPRLRARASWPPARRR